MVTYGSIAHNEVFAAISKTYRFESCHTGTASASRSFTRSPLGAIKESKGSGLSPKSNGRSLLAEFFLTVFTQHYGH
jgi:hypothetical protein